MFIKGMAVAVATTLAVPATAALQWQTDITSACRQAAAENKAVLVDFTGSDWCHWCIRLRKEIMDTPEFEAYAKDKFIPVEIDIPNDRSKNPELYAHNEELAEQYGINGFPTVLVLNAEGVVLGGFVGGRPGIGAVRAPLENALQNIRTWQETRRLQGMERARALMELRGHLGRAIPPAGLEQEIRELDTADTFGLRRAHAVSEQMRNFQNSIRSVRRPQQRLAVIEQILPAAMPENRAALLLMQANMQLLTARTEADIDTVKNTTLAAWDASLNLTETDRAARKVKTEQNFANPADILQKALEKQAEYERRTRAVEEAEREQA